MNRNDVLAYVKSVTYHEIAIRELQQKWPDADPDKGDRHKLYDVLRQKDEWLTRHDWVIQDVSHDASRCVVFSIHTAEDDIITFGEYENNAWGVIDVLDTILSWKEYLATWESPPEEFGVL